MEDKRRPISVEEHKKIMLEILLYFDKFCKEHNLRYYLADGSLIGCIRHQGFIPWDDDIDLEMPRPDWLKLKELFVDQGPYVLCTPYDKDSRFHFSKIYDSRTIKIENLIKYDNNYLGIDIDIFAIDGAPNDEQEFFDLRKKINKLYKKGCFVKCGPMGSYKWKARYYLTKLTAWNPDKLIRKAISLCQTYGYGETDYIARYGRYGLGHRVPKSCYSETLYKDFEGYKLPVPVGYDAVLRAQFGDYMQLPPEEQRIQHHENNIFWKE